MMNDILLSAFHAEEHEAILQYLTKTYQGVFSDENINSHVTNYVGQESAQWPLSVLEQFVKPGQSVLDIGSGFGSFVLLAREKGYLSFGIEPSVFEVEKARLRLQRLLPTENAQLVYQIGFAEDLHNSTKRYDAVTLWNVLEHIPDTQKTLALCHSLLNPGGKLFIVCPNYFTWRDEAHYHLPWSPLDYICKNRFSAKLAQLGRESTYFMKGIVPVTNWGVLGSLWKLDFTLTDFSDTKITLRPSRNMPVSRRRLAALSPFVHSICLVAKKD